MLKVFAVSLVLVSSMSAFALDVKKERAEYDAEVKKACAAEITVANCGDKSVGKGLVKCLAAYKKEHKDYKFSDSCKSVKEKGKALRKEIKAEKAENKLDKAEPVPVTK